MKKIIITAIAATAILLMSAGQAPSVMTKEKGGLYIVNTTTLGKNVEGYLGPTPLKVYIRKGKVEQIEFLKNEETPKYWAAAVKHLKDAWTGKTVKEAKALKVEGRTGATFSSDAIKENVRLALDYYERNK